MERLYSDLASWWPLLSSPKEYADEAAFFGRLFVDAGLPPLPSLLELGCGGGNNALHLKALFSHVTLTDLSPDMLAVSSTLNPECEHVPGDMRTLRLGRVFDAVFIHDAIDYITTIDDLRMAIETAFVHTKPGGVALFVPDHVRETFQPSTDCGGEDGDGRTLRYLEWTHAPEDGGTQYVVDYVYLLREENRPVRIEHDQHICGVFAGADWFRLLNEAGFRSETVRDDYERDVFVAGRPKA